MSLRDTIAAAQAQGAALAQEAWGKELEYRESASAAVVSFSGRISSEGQSGELDAGGLLMEYDAEARWRKAVGNPVPKLGAMLKVKDEGSVFVIRKIVEGEDMEWKVGLER